MAIGFKNELENFGILSFGFLESKVVVRSERMLKNVLRSERMSVKRIKDFGSEEV